LLTFCHLKFLGMLAHIVQTWWTSLPLLLKQSQLSLPENSQFKSV
jgi:hypothetical protein